MLIMPRKAIEAAPDVGPLIVKIQDYFAHEGISLNRFCKQLDISQSDLFRFVTEQRKSVTKAAKVAGSFIDSQHKKHNFRQQGTLPPSLEADTKDGLDVIGEAVNEHWDRSPRSAELIAMLIRAVAPVIEAAGKP